MFLIVDAINVARICHEANRAYCIAIGDPYTPRWGDAPEWQRVSCYNGVKYIMQHPDLTPEDSHKNWLAYKLENGWKYGPVKDAAAKTHPCMVEYAELPFAQRYKDRLFRAIVLSLQLSDEDTGNPGVGAK